MVSHRSRAARAGLSTAAAFLVAVCSASSQAALGQASNGSQRAAASQATSPTITAASDLTFDVASVKPSAPLDMQKLAADMQKGKMPNFGMHLDGLRAEYNYMSLKELVVAAYKAKPYEVTCPDWMATEHYDIVARMPEGSTKEDAPAMLKALLAERFKLQAHVEAQERPVLTLVVGKGGAKMKDSPENPAIDDNAPLKPGERKIDLADGPARYTQTIEPGKGMSAAINMGTRGSYTQKIDVATQSVQVNGTGVSMAGLVDMLSQLMQQLGGSSSKPVVDESGLKGHYEIALNLSLADLMAATRSQGTNPPGGSAGAPGGAAVQASDPGGGGSTVYASIEKLGLKLEPRKAVVQQLVVTNWEKTPTEN